MDAALLLRNSAAFGNKCIYQNSRETKLEKSWEHWKEPQIREYETHIHTRRDTLFRMNGDVAAFSGWGGGEGKGGCASATYALPAGS